MDIILEQKFASYCCEKISEIYMNSQISKIWLLLLFSLFHCYVIGIKAYMIRFHLISVMSCQDDDDECQGANLTQRPLVYPIGKLFVPSSRYYLTIIRSVN